MLEYIPLHVHSQYEIGQSNISIPELVSQAKENGFKALALTGHNVMFGIPQFESAAASMAFIRLSAAKLMLHGMIPLRRAG